MKKYIEIGFKLIERIRNGEFDIGDKLPTERVLSEEYHVPRGIIRDSLTMLEVSGYIKIRQGSGIYVYSLKPNGILASGNNEIDIQIGPFEMLQARQLLESNIASLAAKKATKADIIKIKNILELETKNLRDGNLEYDSDLLFHISVAQASHNSALVDMVRDIWQRRENSFKWNELHKKINDREYRPDWLIDHKNIYVALQRKDSNLAYSAMWTHLENVKNKLFEHSDIDDPNFDGFLFKD